MRPQSTSARGRVTLVCDQCGASFTTPASQLRFYRVRFCSRACKAAHQRVSPVERLWAQVVKTPTCWVWKGLTTPRGYGIMTYEARRLFTHRLAWELARGPIPNGQIVCHVCDTPGCVRNDEPGWYEVGNLLLPRAGHLFLGTDATNVADMDRKGRALRLGQPGEHNAKAKLTDVTVRIIRRRYGDGESSVALATEYGVNKSTIVRIVTRRAWAHVK